MTSYLHTTLTLNSLEVMEGYTYLDNPIDLSNRIVWVFIPFCHHWSIEGQNKITYECDSFIYIFIFRKELV